MLKKTRPAHKDILKISRMRGDTQPILIESWDKQGKKVTVRTDAAGARHLAALLLKHATDIERELPLDPNDGYERVRKDD